MVYGRVPQVKEFNGDSVLLNEGFHYSGRVGDSMRNLDYIVGKLSKTGKFDMSEIRLVKRNGMYDVYVGRKKTTQD